MTLLNDTPYWLKVNDTHHNDTQNNDTWQNGVQNNDIQHNGTQNNDTNHNDTQDNDTQHIDTFDKTQHNSIECSKEDTNLTEYCYAGCLYSECNDTSKVRN
jgi:hypothetical protein